MARQFNGTIDEFINCTAWPEFYFSDNSPMSICGWVQVSTLTPPGQGTFFGQGYDGGVTSYTFIITNSPANGIGFISYDGAATHGITSVPYSTLGWSINEWHHIYGDHNGTTWRIWVDGVHLSSYDTTDAGVYSGGADFDIGSVDTPTGAQQFGACTVADLALFDGPLTGTEILQLGTGVIRPLEVTSKNLRVYYKLDGTGGSWELDSGPSSRDAPIGGTLVADPPYGGPSGALILSDRVLDLGLDVLDQESDAVYVCSDEPTTYAEALSLGLGNKAVTRGTLFNSSAAGTPTGRKISSNSLTTETITTPGTPTWWAVVDSTNTRLLARGPFSSVEALTTGTFNLGVITIGEGGATS